MKLLILIVTTVALQAQATPKMIVCHPQDDGVNHTLMAFPGDAEDRPQVWDKGQKHISDFKKTDGGKFLRWNYGGTGGTDYTVRVMATPTAGNLYMAAWFDFSKSDDTREPDVMFICLGDIK